MGAVYVYKLQVYRLGLFSLAPINPDSFLNLKLFYFFDFFCNLISETLEVTLLDTRHMAADIRADGGAGVAAFLGSKKKCGCCAYEGAADSGDDNGKSFHCYAFFGLLVVYFLKTYKGNKKFPTLANKFAIILRFIHF